MGKSNFKHFQISAITTLNRVCSGGISIMFLSKILLFIFIFDRIWMFACWKVNTAATCTEAIFAQKDRLDFHITRKWSTNLKVKKEESRQTYETTFTFEKINSTTTGRLQRRQRVRRPLGVWDWQLHIRVSLGLFFWNCNEFQSRLVKSL